METVFVVHDMDVKFGECVALSTIRAVEQFIKPKRLAEMYSCALELNFKDFDLQKVQEYQASLVSGSSSGGVAERKPREVPSEAEKDEKRKRKADAVD